MQFNPLFLPSNSVNEVNGGNKITSFKNLRYLFADVVKLSGNIEAGTKEFSEVLNTINGNATNENGKDIIFSFDSNIIKKSIAKFNDGKPQLAASIFNFIMTSPQLSKKLNSGDIKISADDGKSSIAINSLDKKTLQQFLTELLNNSDGKSLKMPVEVTPDSDVSISPNGTSLIIKQTDTSSQIVRDLISELESKFKISIELSKSGENSLNQNSKKIPAPENNYKKENNSENRVNNPTTEQGGNEENKVEQLNSFHDNGKIKFRLDNSSNKLAEVNFPADLKSIDLQKSGIALMKDNANDSEINIQIELLKQPSKNHFLSGMENKVESPQKQYSVNIKIINEDAGQNEINFVKNKLVIDQSIKNLLQKNVKIAQLRTKVSKIFKETGEVNYPGETLVEANSKVQSEKVQDRSIKAQLMSKLNDAQVNQNNQLPVEENNNISAMINEKIETAANNLMNNNKIKLKAVNSANDIPEIDFPSEIKLNKNSKTELISQNKTTSSPKQDSTNAEALNKSFPESKVTTAKSKIVFDPAKKDLSQKIKNSIKLETNVTEATNKSAEFKVSEESSVENPKDFPKEKITNVSIKTDATGKIKETQIKLENQQPGKVEKDNPVSLDKKIKTVADDITNESRTKFNKGIVDKEYQRVPVNKNIKKDLKPIKQNFSKEPIKIIHKENETVIKSAAESKSIPDIDKKLTETKIKQINQPIVKEYHDHGARTIQSTSEIHTANETKNNPNQGTNFNNSGKNSEQNSNSPNNKQNLNIPEIIDQKNQTVESSVENKVKTDKRLNDSQLNLFENSGLTDQAQSKSGNKIPPQRLLNNSEIINKVAELVQRKDKKSIEIKLNPPELGKMKVKVDYSHKKLIVRMEVENESARQMINHNLEQLRQTINQNGALQSEVFISLAGGEQRDSKSLGLKKKGISVSKSLNVEDSDSEESAKMMGYNTYEYLI